MVQPTLRALVRYTLENSGVFARARNNTLCIWNFWNDLLNLALLAFVNSGLESNVFASEDKVGTECMQNKMFPICFQNINKAKAN